MVPSHKGLLLSVLITRSVFIVIAMFIVAGALELKAQENDNGPLAKQFWLDYNPGIKLSERISLHGQIGARANAPYEWTRFLVSPSVRYVRPKHLLKEVNYKEELHGGIGIYFTDNEYKVNRLEIRPFQAYSLTLPNRYRIQIKHLLKLEERFEMETDDWVNTFGLRLRYSASVTFRFHGEIWAKGNGFFIPVSTELFWNLKGTNQFNDKIRLMPGIGRDLSNDWKVLFLVGWFYSKASEEDPFNSSEMLFRLRVYHTFHKKDS